MSRLTGLGIHTLLLLIATLLVGIYNICNKFDIHWTLSTRNLIIALAAFCIINPVADYYVYGRRAHNRVTEIRLARADVHNRELQDTVNNYRWMITELQNINDSFQLRIGILEEEAMVAAGK